MNQGDKVRRRSDGQLAEVVSLADQDLEVETPDGSRHVWGRKSVEVLVGVHKPRGVLAVSDRARAAHRLHFDEGKTFRELGALYGVSYKTVQSWVRDVDQALLDQRRLAALKTG